MLIQESFKKISKLDINIIYTGYNVFLILFGNYVSVKCFFSQSEGYIKISSIITDIKNITYSKYKKISEMQSQGIMANNIKIPCIITENIFEISVKLDQSMINDHFEIQQWIELIAQKTSIVRDVIYQS